MINRDRLAGTFKSLASIDSVSRQEARISGEIRKMLEPMAREILIDRAGEKAGSDTGNLIAKIKGNRNVPPLMLNAHMDTVEPGIGVKPQFKNGVFTSDGTTVLGADDKSAIAIIIETLQILHENNIPHGPLEIVITICEEIGLLGAKNFDFNLLSAKYGYAIDTADTECIITRAPAANRFEILVHGKDAHAGADPENGINAILLASRAISGLELGRIDSETTCNIGVIEARGATNIVPNLVRVKGEVRSHDVAKLEEVTRKIVAAFEDVVTDYRKKNASGSLPRLDIDIENEFSRTFVPDDHPVVVLAKQAAENLGRQVKTKKSGGGSDANVFFEKGIITGVIGTGMQDIHSVRESIRLDDMEKTVRLLLEIIDIHSNGTRRS
ncbi:MAG: M20/M25/M40 family metallo-hydrolase [Desulfobacteraceae bacterium]|nr:M20/M25/M40 family metallo-hydrolase [Desulfobacteraceae bacterium]MBC2754738.1 M20/M25/M40 family metallo-hydrolase [Desulfobacteraceae bacterium]